MNIIRNIRFFILITLCLNSLNALANEYRPRPYSVPQYNKAHSRAFFAFSPLLFIGKFADGLSHNVGKIFENIDLSSGAHIIQEHRVMLSAAGAVIVLSFLVKQLQKSEMCGTWLGEKYTEISTSVSDCAKPHIKKICPKPVRYSIKLLMQFFCNVIKRYIAMNQGTIVYSATAPVAGKLLDNVIGCPIPLLSWTSVGWITSGVVITKAYFDSSFEKVNERFDGIETEMKQVSEKNIAQHTATQEKIGVVQTTINTMGQSITQLFNKIQNLKTGVGQVKEQVGSVLKELVGIKDQVNLLHDKIDTQDKKTVEQYEKLTKRMETLEKLLYQKAERDETLRLELQGFKETYQKDHVALRKDLSETSTHISRQITGVQKEVQEGFSSQSKLLCQPGGDHSKDVHIHMLQLQLDQRSANNS